MNRFRWCRELLFKRWPRLKQEYPQIKWSMRALYWLPMALVFTEYGYTVKVVRGTSMQPTLNPNSSTSNDIVLFDQFSVRVKNKLERGDIVALKSPTNPTKLFVKRIVALGGDTVRTLPPYPDMQIRLPQGHVWVEGDESFRTDDSNSFGPVPLGLIQSKLVYIVWPFNRVGPLHQPSHPDPNSQRTLQWREDMEEWERCRKRMSRVIVGAS